MPTHLNTHRTLLITLTLATTTYADQVNWLNPADSNWDTLDPTTSNWSANALGPNQTPDPTQDAVFNLNAPQHTVTFNTSPTNNRLLIQSDNVKFDLGTNTYTLTNPSASPNASATLAPATTDTATLTITGTLNRLETQHLDVALNGHANLNLTGGTLNPHTTNIAVNPTATAIIDIQSSIFITDNTATIADAGTATINIGTNGSFIAKQTTVAAQNDASATINVNAGTWQSYDAITIADLGHATVNINPDSTVTSGLTRIANNTGSTATITIDDAMWTSSASFRIADEGNATFNINNTAILTNTIGEIANGPDAVGHVNIDNATWKNFGNLTVANEGTATLTATNNAQITSTSARIADQPGSSGTATIDDSAWTAGGSLRVGAEGTGILNIQNTARVINTSARIGSATDSHGTVNIDNSAWSSITSLRLGDDGIGILNATNNALITSDSASIAHDAGSTGTATIDNSTWNNTTDINIANEATGTLNLNNNATLNTQNAYLAPKPTATATATVDNSTWTNAQNLAIAGNATSPGGTATLTLNNNATLQAADTTVWNQGTLQINSGTLQTNTFINHGQTNILTGAINVDGINFAFQNAPNGPGATQTTIAADAQLNVPNGNILNLTTAVLNLDGQLTTRGISNAGFINANNATLNTTHDPLNNNTGTINATNATLNLTGDGNPPPSGTPATDGLANRATINLTDSTINGDLHSPAGSTFNAAGTLTFNGHVSGAANINGPATLIFNAGYSPGDSTAAVNADGNIILGPDNTLNIEVRTPSAIHPTPATDFDQLNITQDLAPNGTLHIAPLPAPEAFTAPLGTQFPIINFATRNATQTNSAMFKNITGTLINTNLALAPLLNDTNTGFTLRASIPGDLNLDNKVSIEDLSIFALNFNTTPGLYNESLQLNSWQLGDFNTDGQITTTDLSLLALNFGFDATAPSSAPLGLTAEDLAAYPSLTSIAIPEPGTAALTLVLTCQSLLTKRKRTRR